MVGVRPSSDGVPNLPHIGDLMIGKSLAVIEKGEWGDVQLYRGRPGSEVAVGNPVSCYARLATVIDDRWVYIYDFPTGKEIAAVEC